jgi:hypothetical protein
MARLINTRTDNNFLLGVISLEKILNYNECNMELGYVRMALFFVLYISNTWYVISKV